jgi:hypothetical protein
MVQAKFDEPSFRLFVIPGRIVVHVFRDPKRVDISFDQPLDAEIFAVMIRTGIPVFIIKVKMMWV